MKKLFALLAVVLAVVSCQKDVDNLDVNVGGEQLVNITVGLPEATRVASDTGFDFANLGNNFELRYILEIYAEGNTTDCIRKEVFTKNQSVVFPVRLIHGRDYHVVAWADIVPANANRTAEGDYDYYYETSNGLTAVEIISWNAMDEYRDAFTTFADIENFSANRSLDLTLVRPFAKIRVVSTDIKDIEDLGFELGRGEVTYRYDMYRKFNAYTGTASDAASKAHTFTYPTVYAQSGDADETETQRTLYADYIFVDDVKNPDVVQFTMNVWDSNDVLIKETQFMTDIPVHANKLTTIIGEVLTEGGNVKITIDNGLAEQERVTVVSSASHLLKVINAGGEYILGNNIVVTVDDINEFEKIITRATNTTTINLNGYDIELANGAEVVVEAGNTLVINNQPEGNNGPKGAITGEGTIVNNGTLTIEGGYFSEGAIVNNGTTNVIGGEFEDDAIVNNGTTHFEGENAENQGNIVVNGDNAVVSNLAGCAEDLQDAIDNAIVDPKITTIIKFGADITGNIYIAQKEGVNLVIDGADFDFDGTITVDGKNRNYGAETLKITNIQFLTEDAEKTFIALVDTYGNDKERYSHNVTIEGCSFYTSSYNEKVGAINALTTYNLTVKNCSAQNLHSLLQAQSCDTTINIEEVTVNNCASGISVGNTKVTNINKANINARKYALRAEGTSMRTVDVTVSNSNFSAYAPITVRKVTTGSDVDLKLSNTTLNRTTEGLYDVVFQNNKDYEDGNVTPEVPTGKWTIEGADNYIVFPRNHAEGVWMTWNGYELFNESGLNWLATSVNEGNTFAGKNVVLKNDVTLANAWTPIGTLENVFNGTFDGNYKTISNLVVDGVDYAAMIAYAGKDAVIKNLTANVNINSTKYAAGIVCQASEGVTLENVTVNGSVTAVSYAGGLIHNVANAVVKNCVNNANVSANRAGGIASWASSNATIEDVVNNGNITGGVGASGIAHGFAGTIKNAVNNGNIVSSNVEPAAGIAGVQKAASTYEYCYNYGDVTSKYDNVNASACGILGQTPGSACTLNYCANYGKVTAEQSHAAGIAYSLYGQINASYCYNAGNVFGADSAGGIAPKAEYGSGDKANYCLNAGEITSNGTVYQASKNNTSCYYYNAGQLLNVANATVTDIETALAILNGGENTEFFSVVDGVITVE